MIEALVNFALRQRVVIVVATAVLIFLGTHSMHKLPIEAYPDVADPWVQLIVQWPGHAPEEMERRITIPVERAMAGVAGKQVTRSTTVSGLSVVTMLFDEEVDTFLARQQVTERLSSIELPDGAEAELGPVSSPTGEILRFYLVDCAVRQVAECGPDDLGLPARSLTDLKDLEEFVVEPELTSAAGVADVASFGGPTREYQVLVDPIKLASFGLTFEQVERALRNANGNAGGGTFVLGAQSLGVRGVGLLTPEQIGEVALASVEGSPVRVRQVAKVVAGHKVRLGRVSVDDADDVVAGTVLLLKGYDAERALAALHERIEQVNTRVLPRGVKIHPYHDRADLLRATTRTVLGNLAEGIALVTLVLFVFLGSPRAALVVACTIPLSLAFAFTCLRLAEVPANLLSMGALDFGMIVDGAIVMVENIHRELERHPEADEDERRALVAGASREVSRPIVFSLGILVTAYLPILLLERVEGKLFRPLAITVGFALLGALCVAVTVVPMLASYFLRARRRTSAPAAAKEAREFVLLRWVRRLYMPLLRRAVAAPRWLLPIAVLLLVGNGLLVRRLGTEFLPHLDEGAVWLRVTLPTNVSLAEAAELADGVHQPGRREFAGVREILRGYPEIETVAVQIGRPDDGTDPVGYYNSEFLMVLRPRAEWRAQFGGSKEQLIESVAAHLDDIPGILYGFSQPISDNVEEALTGVKGQLAIKIIGPDLQALDELAGQIARVVREVPGVTDLGILRQLGQSNVEVRIDRARAERYGLEVAEVEDAIEHGIGGQVVTQIVQGEWFHDLRVRFAPEVRSDLDAMRSLLLPTTGGQLVPLSQLAEVSVQGGAARILREDGKRTLAIKFGVRGRDLGGAVLEAQAKVAEAVRVPVGYELRWAGEFESASRAGARLALVIPVTLACIFVLLFALFRDFRDALLVLLNVLVVSPLGGLSALLLSGHQLSVSSAVGFLALFGVSVQTGVLLISFIDAERRRGVPLEQAILRAAELRLRPIVMTALVATLGLVPAALSHDIGSDSQRPLAIVVVGGLFSSLVLSLFTLPMGYKLLARREAQ